MKREDIPPSRANLMSGEKYRESLRQYKPVVYVDGRLIESVADEPMLRPGVNALAFTYDYALDKALEPIALATQHSRNRVVSRMLHVNESSGDLLNKLEAVRVLCQETGCAQRYLGGDALAAIEQTTARLDAELGTSYGERFHAYLERVYAEDLALGVAMTDGKGDRSRRPSQQANPDAYLRIIERRKSIAERVLAGAAPEDAALDSYQSEMRAGRRHCLKRFVEYVFL